MLLECALSLQGRKERQSLGAAGLSGDTPRDKTAGADRIVKSRSSVRLGSRLNRASGNSKT